MVFKAVSGTGADVYNTYTSKQTYSEKVMATLDVTKRHHSHYKNRIVLEWKKFGASEVTYKSVHVDWCNLQIIYQPTLHLPFTNPNQWEANHEQ